MIEELPTYITLLFGLTVVTTLVWFFLSCKSKKFLIIAIGWTILQSILGARGFYQNIETIPPRIMLFGVVPTIVAMALMFLTHRGQEFIDNIDLKTLTYFHTIRIPVEIVLVLLYYQGLASVYMTFEGTNFDLFSGITASVVAYIAFRSGTVNKKLLLGWNIICLLLLINVVITAVFALPSPFQKISLDQPNVAILYFPFNLLPTVIVPMVLFGHLVAIRQLTKHSNYQKTPA